MSLHITVQSLYLFYLFQKNSHDIILIEHTIIYVKPHRLIEFGLSIKLNILYIVTAWNFHCFNNSKMMLKCRGIRKIRKHSEI